MKTVSSKGSPPPKAPEAIGAAVGVDAVSARGARLNASSISAVVSPFFSKNARFVDSGEDDTCGVMVEGWDAREGQDASSIGV